MRVVRRAWLCLLFTLPTVLLASLVGAIPIDGTLFPSAAISASGTFSFQGLGPDSLAVSWTPSPDLATAGFHRTRLLISVQEAQWETLAAGADPGRPTGLRQSFRQYEVHEATVRVVATAPTARWVLTSTQEGVLHAGLGSASACEVAARPPVPVVAHPDPTIPVPTEVWTSPATTLTSARCSASAVTARGPMQLAVSGSTLEVTYVDPISHRDSRLTVETGRTQRAARNGLRVDHAFSQVTFNDGTDPATLALPGGPLVMVQAASADVDGALRLPQGQVRGNWGGESMAEARAVLQPSGTFRVSAVGDSIAFRGEASKLFQGLAWGAGSLAVVALAWKFGVPPLQLLFTRIEEDRVLQHQRRRRILDFVVQNPGLTAARIAILLGVARSSVEYHLAVLAREGLVARRRFGRRGAVFPAGTHTPEGQERLYRLRQPSFRAVLDALGDKASLSQMQIVDLSGFSQSRVSTILRKLIAIGLVESSHDGRILVYRSRRAF